MIKELVNVIKRAGKEQKRRFCRNEYSFVLKDDQSPVSNVDMLTQERLIRFAKRNGFVNIISEEQPCDLLKKGARTIMMDPLGGTENYVNGLVYWSINVSVMERSKLTGSIIYFPYFDEMFVIAGGKVTRNGKRLERTMNGCKLVALSNKWKSSPVTQCDMRRFGNTAFSLMMAARGYFDLFASKGSAKIWDCLAGFHMIKTLGGYIWDGDFKNIVIDEEYIFKLSKAGESVDFNASMDKQRLINIKRKMNEK